MKQLIALAAIAAAADHPAFNAGESLTVSDEIADKMVADGVAKPADEPKPKAKLTKVRLLTDCRHGKADTVVALDAADLKEGEQGGFVDSNKGAVAYAESLAKSAAE